MRNHPKTQASHCWKYGIQNITPLLS